MRFAGYYSMCEACNALLQHRPPQHVLDAPYIQQVALSATFAAALYAHLTYFYWSMAMLMGVIDEAPHVLAAMRRMLRQRCAGPVKGGSASSTGSQHHDQHNGRHHSFSEKTHQNPQHQHHSYHHRPLWLCATTAQTACEWPPLFRSPWLATSPVDLWNKRWHQCFR